MNHNFTLRKLLIWNRNEVRAINNSIKSVQIIPVIETKSTRGNGTSADPIRIVTQYWTTDGKLIAERTG